MELYEETIERINNDIMEQFEGFYKKHLYQKKKIEFKPYFHSVTLDTWEEIQNLIQVTNDTLYPVAKRRQMTKKRWAKRELEGDMTSGFRQKIDVMAKIVYDTSRVEFEKLYGDKSFDELREEKLEELFNWEKDEERLICEFPYLEYKKWTQIEPALINDMKYLIIKTIKEQYPTGERGEVLTMPNSMTNLPYDHTNRGKMQSLEIFQNKYIREIYTNDNTIFETRLSVEALNEELMSETFKLLNALDHAILLYLMSLRHEALYQPIPMVIEIGEIVKNVFTTKGKKSYMAVKASILKMHYMAVTVINKDTLMNTNVKIFSAVIGKDEVTNREVARITFSEELINEFVKDQTVSVYKKIIDQFSLSASKILIYALQRQRNSFVSTEVEGDSILFHTNLTFFRGVLFIGTSKRSVQIKTIEKALNEIIKSNITLKSFTRKGDSFILEFYPFTAEELRDLTNKKAPEKFLRNRSKTDKILDNQLQLTLN